MTASEMETTVQALTAAGKGILAADESTGTLAAMYGWLLEPIGWEYAMGVWAYALAWFPVNNAARDWVLDLWEHGFGAHARHLVRTHASLHACACSPASCACPPASSRAEVRT